MKDDFQHDGYAQYEENAGDEFVQQEEKPKVPLEDMIDTLMDHHHLQEMRDNLQMMKDLGIIACLKEAAPQSGQGMVTAVDSKINTLDQQIMMIHEQNQFKLYEAGHYEVNKRDGAYRTPLGGISHRQANNQDQWDYQAPPPRTSITNILKGTANAWVENKTGGTISLRSQRPSPYAPQRGPPPGYRRRRPPPPRYYGY